MEESLRKVIGNYVILDSPFLVPVLIYIFDETYVKHLSISNQNSIPVFGYFSIFFLICNFFFF